MAAPEERRWIDSNNKKEQQRLSQQLRVRRQPADNDDDIRRGAATCAHAYLGVAHVARQSDHFLRVLLRDAAFVRVILWTVCGPGCVGWDGSFRARSMCYSCWQCWPQTSHFTNCAHFRRLHTSQLFFFRHARAETRARAPAARGRAPARPGRRRRAPPRLGSNLKKVYAM